jgi:hypothetical protein
MSMTARHSSSDVARAELSRAIPALFIDPAALSHDRIRRLGHRDGIGDVERQGRSVNARFHELADRLVEHIPVAAR